MYDLLLLRRFRKLAHGFLVMVGPMSVLSETFEFLWYFGFFTKFVFSSIFRFFGVIVRFGG